MAAELTYGVRVTFAPDAGHGAHAVGQIELQLAVLVRQAAGARRAAAAAERLERSAYLLLSVLTENGPTSVNALADRLGLNASTITRQVDAMAFAGLVRRVKHPDDGRVTLVAVTERGVRHFAADREARRRFFAEVTASWSASDRADLARLLTRLNEDLDTVARAVLSGSGSDQATAQPAS